MLNNEAHERAVFDKITDAGIIELIRRIDQLPPERRQLVTRMIPEISGAAQADIDAWHAAGERPGTMAVPNTEATSARLRSEDAQAAEIAYTIVYEITQESLSALDACQVARNRVLIRYPGP